MRNPDSQYFAGYPAFAGKIVDDTVSAPVAWSLTLYKTTVLERPTMAAKFLRMFVTPFPRLHTAELPPFDPEADDDADQLLASALHHLQHTLRRQREADLRHP